MSVSGGVDLCSGRCHLEPSYNLPRYECRAGLGRVYASRSGGRFGTLRWPVESHDRLRTTEGGWGWVGGMECVNDGLPTARDHPTTNCVRCAQTTPAHVTLRAPVVTNALRDAAEGYSIKAVHQTMWDTNMTDAKHTMYTPGDSLGIARGQGSGSLNISST